MAHLPPEHTTRPISSHLAISTTVILGLDCALLLSEQAR
jgi:hypothetical protein